jgi:lipopolysaccharide/colanic/teichoic acid biosynthesis glycosyltransferase/glycosyltransferase involved in cell wall biosynthesis
MKNQDDGTLSLFDDFPPANDPAAKAATPKKPRVKSKTTEIKEEAEVGAPDPGVNVEATLHLAGLVDPQPRRNSPWAGVNPTVLQAVAKIPHVMLVITKGEAGGAQSHVLALCQALIHRVKFTVVIGGPVEASVLGRELTAMGVTVCPMPEMVESLNPFKLWPAVLQLVQLIAAHPPDLIHAHSAIAGLAARLACRTTARPVIYTVHGFGFKQEIPWLRRTVASIAERALARHTTQMICVSKYERELAGGLPIEQHRVQVIPNGIPLRKPALDTSDASAAEKATLPVGQEPLPRLIMVARLKSPKRQDLLLQALSNVRNTRNQELPVTFAGDGPEAERLQRIAADFNLKEITWAGDVADVPALLSQHDVFVLLSDHEGMPITILEAMRAGMCIVASDLPGIQEQISQNQEGLLVPNDAGAIAEQLMRLIQEPYLQKRLGRAAKNAFESLFTADDMAKQVMSVYQKCLREDGATSRPQAPHENVIGSPLMSASVRRRDALQSWALWGLWLLVPSLMAAQCFEDAGLMTYQFGETLWWCVVPYAIAAHLLMRTSHLPVAERSGVLWVSTSAPLLFTPLGFALLQQPYSRAAVLWAYAATTLWLGWGYHRHVKHRALRLVHIDANVPAQLAACLTPKTLDTQSVQLLPWNAYSELPLPACDGIVLDRHVRTTDERTRLLGELKMQHLRLYSVEAVAELTSGRKMLPTAADTLWEIDNDPSYDRIKRWLDVITVLALAPLWLPLAACVAAAVRYDSKGPALFSQPRVGRDGQVFTLWKFRSMVHGLQAPGVDFAQAEDPRITRVGKFLRRSRLDELPQLFNVLAGHMSLIGPRPEQTAFVRDFAATIPSYPYRHLVRPGLTGWAQVQQGYADSVDTTRVKLSYDLYYVAHYSLALDLLIAAKTVKTVCTGFGSR